MKDPPVSKQRLLSRLGRQLVVHVHIISGLCYTMGVLLALLLPLLGKNTHISENALMPGMDLPKVKFCNQMSQGLNFMSMICVGTSKTLSSLSPSCLQPAFSDISLPAWGSSEVEAQAFTLVLPFCGSSGNPVFGISDIIEARALAAEVKNLLSEEKDNHRAVTSWLIKHMAALGGDCYVHPFYPPDWTSAINFPTASHHFKQCTPNRSSVHHLEQHEGPAVNVVGIIRGPQAEGSEAIVLVTPIGQHLGQEDALSLGVGLALFAQLCKALWIARDIVWLIPDAKYGVYPAVAEWLREYHEPSINRNAKLKSHFEKGFLDEDGQLFGEQIGDATLSDFKRAGTIATGLVFELKNSPGWSSDTIYPSVEGTNGQMPNLDLFNIINSIAVWRENMHVQLEYLHLKGSAPMKVRAMLERISNLASKINPAWDFSLAASAYPTRLATLLNSMFYQVIGLPTGAHGAFRDYQIDAVSLQFSVKATVSDYSLSKIGRLLEGVIRSVNNLLEKWHHSVFLYLLPAPYKYISISVYIIPFTLLLICLPLTAAALCFPAKEVTITEGSAEGVSVPKHIWEEHLQCRGQDKRNTGQYATIADSGNWLKALLLVSIIQCWAFFVAFTMSLISKANFTAELKLSSWLVIAVISFRLSLAVHESSTASFNIPKIPPQHRQTQIWAAVKSLTLGLVSIGLVVMSTINYPVSLFGALILVPMCLGVFPLKYGWKQAHRPGKNILTWLPYAAGALLSLCSPLIVAGLIRICCGRVWRPTPGNFWDLMEGLLTWRSALFPYLLVIHLPCFVLCMYILFSADQYNSL